jgi:hypothetical protein
MLQPMPEDRFTNTVGKILIHQATAKRQFLTIVVSRLLHPNGGGNEMAFFNQASQLPQ